MLSLTKVGGWVGVSSITRAVLLSFVQEVCLQTLAKGLLIYSVLLKHVEKEYRGSLNFSGAPSNIGTLIDLAGMVKGKVGLTRVFNYVKFDFAAVSFVFPVSNVRKTDRIK